MADRKRKPETGNGNRKPQPETAYLDRKPLIATENRKPDAHPGALPGALPGPEPPNIIYWPIRFRLHAVAITADIKQMYRQVLVHPDHRKYQLIVWRFSSEDNLEIYQLNTVTYGVSSAPYLAQRTILELAKLEKDKFPIASQIVSTEIYVDDVVTGCASLEEAEIVKIQLISLFQSGGFELRKWSSNVPEFLSNVSEASSSSLCLDNSESHDVKVLGLHWQPDIDCFIFRVKPLVRGCTKRNILSEVARIFDPLGFLAPLTFFAKHLVQQLWTLKLDWDETPTADIVLRWSQFKSELPYLESLRIDRRLWNNNVTSCQLHGFCDASEAGYAAVVYFRVMFNETVFVSFVSGKSKVAPLKRISIPRLELCAAVLLAELIDTLKGTYQNRLSIGQTYAWSDSTIALCWINSSPHRWKTFVSNRVTHIQDKTPNVIWSHVSSLQNPADCASRGLLPRELADHALWWTGPEWLRQSTEFPLSPCPPDISPEVQAEERKTTLVVETVPHFLEALMRRFSSLRKIQGTLSYCLRLIRKSKFVTRGPLSCEELYQAMCVLVKYVQSQYFAGDISLLQKGKDCSKSLRKLAPFLDDNGVVRVGGRLRNADIPYDQKHPMLLPRRCRLTELVIDQVHKANLHPGPQMVQYLVQQNFWIFSCRRAVKGRIARCYRCFRSKPVSINPLMGDLPAPRVSQLKPFLHTGVDFAGPFIISISKYRGCKTAKAYICVFVCFCTKAMHLELVSSLSTQAFITALRRFIARRGRCSNLYRDCGTNFVGANKQLQSLAEEASGVLGITWKFNPPSSPHFGGLWEAGVKSVKTHLVRVVGEQILTYEEFTTVLTQIESVLNSRPLTAMSTDPNDLQALTPGHFLTLEPLTAPPDETLSSLPLNRLSRWQLLQRCHQDFWKRWQMEYLHSLQERSKCNKVTPSLREGELVVIKQDSAPPLQWHLGRIISLIPGPDGTSRVATVRTRSGLLRRPIVKLCALPGMKEG